MSETDLIILAEGVVARFRDKGLTLSLAESCTGGWISKIITEVSGSSAVYLGGVCSYSNQVKMDLLGVKEETLRKHGAVSEETAREMVDGIRKATGSDIGVAVTGIAGPLSDNTRKPVGLIYVCVSNGHKTICKELRNSFSENIRFSNRYSAVETALTLLGDLE